MRPFHPLKRSSSVSSAEAFAVFNRHHVALARRLLLVAAYLGDLLTIFGLVLMTPAVVGLIYHEYRCGMLFLLTGAFTATLGLLLHRVLPHGRMGMREAILFCTSAWVLCSLLAAIPMHLSTSVGYLNCLLESVSGLTTTGLTTLHSLELQPRTIIFWRSTSQLLGGLGILSFFLLVSYPGSAAHRLFQSETTKTRLARPAPGLRHTVIITWGIYGLLLAFNLIVLLALGAGGFNAINYAFTTTATGGFAPHSLGVGYYRAIGHPGAAAIEMATVFFMALGGVNYLLHYRALSGNVRVIFSGTEARRYWLLILFGIALVMIETLSLPGTWEALGHIAGGQVGGNVGLDALRYASFQIVSVTSTAGHLTLPLESVFFGPAARQFFLFALLVGGCAGSTAGGVKVLRGTVLSRGLLQELRKLVYPEGATLPVVLDGHVIETKTVQPIAAMIFAWTTFSLGGGILLSLISGRPSLECLSLSISSLSNVGPSLMPMAQIAALPAAGKVLLMIWMVAGRLEILPVLVLLSRRLWRH